MVNGFTCSNVKDIVRKMVKNAFIGKRLNWFGSETEVLKIPFMNSWFLPDSDLVIATEWPTAYFVNKLDLSKGKKIYFVQGYEAFLGNNDLVDATYSLPLSKIVVSRWLQILFKDKFNQDSFLAMNGVNQSIFYDKAKELHNGGSKRILMAYHSNPVKGIEDGLAAFKLARMEIPNLNLVMFGAWKGKEVPDWVEFHINPCQEALRKLYCSCAVFLSSSRMEGFLLPPMEAMACRLPTVLTNVGAVPEYTIPGRTALVSEPGNIQALAQNLIRILSDEQFAADIGNAGYDYVRRFSLETAGNSFENILKTIYQS
jgi:glycosyltransferase involved in cell wall biosynthesis